MTQSASESQASETQVPSSYTLAAHRDAWLYAHDLPQQQGNSAGSEFDYILNAGFLVIGPSRSLYNYYMTLLGAANSLNTWAMAQSLLNYVHRQEGDMPWQELSHKWNTNWPSQRDLDSGVLSFHDKFWQAEKNQGIDQHLAALWRKQRKEMLKYWQ